MAAAMDLTARDTIAAGLRAAVLQFGGFDSVVNTAALYPTPDPSVAAEGVWAQDAADQRHGQLRPGAGSREGPEGAEPSGVDRADELGERRRAQGAAARRTTSARRRSTT